MKISFIKEPLYKLPAIYLIVQNMTNYAWHGEGMLRVMAAQRKLKRGQFY